LNRLIESDASEIIEGILNNVKLYCDINCTSIINQLIVPGGSRHGMAGDP